MLTGPGPNEAERKMNASVFFFFSLFFFCGGFKCVGVMCYVVVVKKIISNLCFVFSINRNYAR